MALIDEDRINDRMSNIMPILTGSNGYISWIVRILDKKTGKIELRAPSNALNATVNLYLIIPKII